MRPETLVEEDRRIRILLVLLMAGALVPIWAAPLPPLQDLPNHLLKVDIFERWLRGEEEVRRLYVLNLRPLANYACYAILLLLSPFVSLIAGARILLSIIVIALPASAYAFLKRVNPGNTLFALAVPALSFNLFLMMGNLNFCLGLAVYLAGLAVFLSRDPRRARVDGTFALLATGLYFTHGFIFLILLGSVGGLLAIDFDRVRARRAWGLAPGLLCLLVNISENLGSGGEAAGAFHPSLEAPGLDSIRVAIVWLLNPHGWGFDTPFALAWLAAIALCLVGTLAGPLRRALAAERPLTVVRDNVWLALALVLAIGYFIAPAQLRDWFHLRARFSPLAALILLGALRTPRRRGARAAVAIVLVLAAIAIEARNSLEFVRRGALVKEYADGVEAVEPGASVIPFENLEPGPKYRYNLHSWAYYVIARGGWGPYLHVQPSYNPVLYRVAPWAPGEGRPPGPQSEVQWVAQCYDYALLWNPTDADAAALGRWFERIRATPHLSVWRNRSGVRRGTPATNPACRKESRAALALQ